MAKTVEMEVKGFKSLEEALKTLPARFQNQVVKPAMKATMKQVVLPQALHDVAVKTGNLQRSLKVRTAKGRNGQRLPRGVAGFTVQTTKTKTRDGYYGKWVFANKKNRDGTIRKGDRTLRNALYNNQSLIRSTATAKMRKGLPMAVLAARHAAAGKG